MVDDNTGADAAAKAAADKAAADAAANNQFDPSKIPDDQFSKVFDDKRTFTHPRFKELLEAKDKLKAKEAADKKAEEERMIKNQEFEKLAKAKDDELQKLRTDYQNTRVENALTAEAYKKGISDVDLVLKLVDRATIKLNDDGSIAGLTEAVDQLLKDRPYLKNIKNIKIGNGTNPPDANDGGKIKMSQIQDPKFYQANRDKINEARRTGNIIDDRPGAR